MTALRPCGCTTNAPDHADVEPDWIGNTPILHGESERPIPDTADPYIPDAYCLCGHPPYQGCPGWLNIEDSGAWGGGIMDLEVERP